MARPRDPGRSGPIANVQGEQQPGFRDAGLAPLGVPSSMQGANGGLLLGAINPAAPTDPRAIAQEQNRVARETLVAAQAIASSLQAAAESAQTIANGMGASGAGGGRRRSHGPVGRSSEEAIADAARRERGPAGVSPASGAPQPPLEDTSPAAWRTADQHYSLRSLQQDAARGALKHLNTWRPAQEVDAHGQFSNAAKVLGGVRNTLGAMAGGEGAAGAVRQGVMQAAPKLGAALGGVTAGIAVAQQVRGMVGNQMAQNREWQGLLGGDQGDAMGERVGEKVFQFRQNLGNGLMGLFGGGMGAGEASKLYRGAAGIFGTEGDARGRAQDFGVKMFNDLGVSVSESLDLIRESARSGNETLTNLATSLDRVTESARNAGYSAQQARQIFTQNLGAAGSAVGGYDAPVISAAMTEFQMGLGREYADVDMTGLFSQTSQITQASAMGMDLASFETSGAQTIAAGQTEQLKTVAARLIGQQYLDWGLAEIRKVADANGGLVPDEEWRRVGDEIARRSGKPPSVIAQSLKALTGISIDPAQVMQFLLKQFDDANSIKGKTDARFTQATPSTVDMGGKSIGESFGDKGALGEKGKELGLEDWKSRSIATEAGSAGMLEDFKKSGDYDDISNIGWNAQLGGEERAVVDYLAALGRGGETNPILEQLFKEQDLGSGDLKKWKVRTKDGDKVVNTQDLVRYYSDQVAAGTVTVAEGDLAGTSVAELSGLPGAAPGSAAPTSATADAQGDAKDPEAGEGGSGRVEIAPTEELRRYFRFTPSGGAYVAGAQYDGTPTPARLPIGPSTPRSTP